ncbi:DUF6479 family protein [Streptomyces sp. NPDC046197]|uniref:DUF6479 family protein n=1 Tax=Streptomyces sp. NPDC046197 TaxID=3154337 RepID=UPI0033E6DC60
MHGRGAGGAAKRVPAPVRCHPTLPGSGPVHETRHRREPDEVPRAEETGRRLTPHDLGSAGSRRSEEQTRPRWKPGSSGSFGSGGPGS